MGEILQFQGGHGLLTNHRTAQRILDLHAR